MSDHSSWLEKQKGLWTRRIQRVYDEIAEDVDKEFKRRGDEEHRTELKKRDEQQRILSGCYNEEIVKNAFLTEENSRFHRHLEKLDQRKSTSAANAAGTRSDTALPAAPSSKETDATVPCEEYHQLTEKFNELHKKHQEATQRLKYLERKNIAVMQKNKEMKESVLAWQKFSDRHYAKQKIKAEGKSMVDVLKMLGQVEEVSSPVVPPSLRSSIVKTPRSFDGRDGSSPAPMALLSHVEYPTADEEVISGHIDNANATSVHPEPRQVASPFPPVQLLLTDWQNNPPEDVGMASRDETIDSIREGSNIDNKLPSSQTTEYDTVTQNALGAALLVGAIDDDDVPVAVSERSLKRKRGNSTKFPIYGDRLPTNGTPANPFRIKEEPQSSSPAITPPSKLLRKETLDLDQLGPNVISTPYRRIRRISAATAMLRHQRSTSVPLIKEETMEDGHYREPNDASAGPRSPRYHYIPEIDNSDMQAYSEPSQRPKDSLQPLRPLDPNSMTATHTEENSNKRFKKGNARRLTKLQLLTESSEQDPPPMDENYGRPSPSAARAQFNQKLKTSKNMETPAKSTARTPVTAPTKSKATEVPTPPSSTSRASDTPCIRSGARKAAQSEPRKTPISNPRPTWPATGDGHMPKPQPQQRLRYTPVSNLKLSDFKANPKYNQGYSYAFSETVRKRGDRACLPGCTGPECCGSTFRALAEAAAPLSLSQEEALLEDFLGHAFDNTQIEQMSPEERDTLVLQARTREMANKYGRHRQAYERHKTPPGFWRVDFPTTQEQQEDREKAMQMERDIIEQRRTEALRNSGRWMFRDE